MLESDDKLFEIWKQFDFNIDPSNAETEKEKFLKNRDYSPKFEYLRVLNLEHFKKNLLNIKTDNSWIGKLIKERIENILKKVEMLSNRNNESFTKSSVQLFGKPSKETTDEAKKLLQLREELEIKNLFCTDARRIISRALVENKLRGWHVEIRDDMSATAKVDSADRVVCIKKGEKFSSSGIERLIVHELQTHAFRLENARLQKYKLFQIGFPNYLVTEEGIATLNEEKAEYLLNDKIKKLYAGRIIAVNLALEKGFADVFAELEKYFSEEDAWNITLRVKRGLQNTGHAGAFTKDHLYLTGNLKIKEFLKKGNLTDLYVGKIGIEHLPLMKDFKELKQHVFLPNIK